MAVLVVDREILQYEFCVYLFLFLLHLFPPIVYCIEIHVGFASCQFPLVWREQLLLLLLLLRIEVGPFPLLGVASAGLCLPLLSDEQQCPPLLLRELSPRLLLQR